METFLLPKRRQELYIKARMKLDHNKDRIVRMGFCSALSEFFTLDEQRQQLKYADEYRKSFMEKQDKSILSYLAIFPEILKYEPKVWYNEMYFFEPFGEGIKKRIEILDQIISDYVVE